MYAYFDVYADIFARIKQRGHDVHHLLPTAQVRLPMLTMTTQNNADILVPPSEKTTQLTIVCYEKASEPESLIDLMEDVLGELLREGHDQLPWEISRCRMKVDYQWLENKAVVAGQLTIVLPLTKRTQ
ncbi:hypothetical protein [Brochothrix campestris]|uniref:Phage protein n=1 Tax=Brochothrix campestris FSL F6-1037 TaxID=1265861 RepID=W7D5W8_9LIST|nr:hypothetical protein [Brochothrix campestris]EUJ40683.1 hypothetical protein BCAMP_04817 [Brochothrix campestris FSL F6-1037]